ncbi:MAG: hypothetical protein ACI398_09305 [Clostridium sp.]
MNNIILYSNKDVPQYLYDNCGKCSSLFSISLCSKHNRGCCWYFPKFTLYEIHKMVKSEKGLAVLNRILKLPKVEIFNYYIHAIGYFDESSYKKFLKSKKSRNYKVHDKSMFFRECPFVKEGCGCTIDPQYRSYICNLFICDEVLEKVKDNPDYDSYIKERENFVRWIDWENTSIQMMLEEQNLNLIHHMDKVIEILKELPFEHYEFPELNPIKEKDLILNI